MEDNYRITDDGIEDLRYEIVEDHNDDWNNFVETVLAQNALSAEDRAIFDRFIIEIETVPSSVFSLALDQAYGLYFNWCLGMDKYGNFSRLFLENWIAKRYKTYMINLSDKDPSYAIRVLALQKNTLSIDHPFWDAVCGALEYCKDISSLSVFGKTSDDVSISVVENSVHTPRLEVKTVALIQYYLITAGEVEYIKLSRGQVSNRIAQQFGLQSGDSLYNAFCYWTSKSNRMHGTESTRRTAKRRAHFSACIEYLESNNFRKAHALAVTEFDALSD